MSTRLCLSFDRTPQWFNDNKVLFHFDKTTCRVVSDLEYLIRRKFSISSVCHLYLNGYLLPSQETIAIVRDGDNLRVENEDLHHSREQNLKIDNYSPKKRKSLHAKLPDSKCSKSTSVRSQSLCSSNEILGSSNRHNQKCTLRSTRSSSCLAFSAQGNSKVSCKNNSSQCQPKQTKSISSRPTKRLSSSKKNQSNVDSNANKLSTKQKREKTKTVASEKLSAASSFEDSSPELDDSQSTESSSEAVSSATESSSDSTFTPTQGSSDAEASETESPSSKSLVSSKNQSSETSVVSSTLESGYAVSSEGTNSKNHRNKHSMDKSASPKARHGRNSGVKTVEKSSKGVTNLSKTSSTPPKESNTSKSISPVHQPRQQSNKRSTQSTENNSSSMADGFIACREAVTHFSTNTFTSQNAAQPTRILNAKHIYFDSDEDQCSAQQAVGNNCINPQTVNRSCNDEVGNRVSNSIEQGTGNSNMQPFNGCQVNVSSGPLVQIQEQKTLNTTDFSALPPLCGPPRAGDRIAYKILEISASYTPELSDFKEGVVLAYDPNNGEVLVELTPESLIKPLGDGNVSNKFELLSADEDDENVSIKPPHVLERKIAVLWSSMISPKLINS